MTNNIIQFPQKVDLEDFINEFRTSIDSNFSSRLTDYFCQNTYYTAKYLLEYKIPILDLIGQDDEYESFLKSFADKFNDFVDKLIEVEGHSDNPMMKNLLSIYEHWKIKYEE